MIRKKTASLDLNELIKSLYLLMKPRVMSLVIFTCAVGFLTSNSDTSISNAMISIIFVAVGAGAAGCLNMWYESDLDALMTRTCLRPIPTGKINRKQALIFGVLLSFISVIALNYFSNFLSACLLMFTIFFLPIYLYNMAKKKNATKYCYWWSSWSIASSYRLDNCHKHNWFRTISLLFNNFFLDAFSFLGIEFIQG